MKLINFLDLKKTWREEVKFSLDWSGKVNWRWTLNSFPKRATIFLFLPWIHILLNVALKGLLSRDGVCFPTPSICTGFAIYFVQQKWPCIYTSVPCTLLISLRSLPCCHVNKPGLACWRTGDPMKQRPAIPVEALPDQPPSSQPQVTADAWGSSCRPEKLPSWA